ncbi:MAG: alpha/beta hydrolase-fold protein [Candidatus Izemoplasmatales bacterium]|jgi:predicted alpha/beta superfamily hydrolase|nr:alpha/beta hydrolase-fold protein [Candidatus Izemoplasmatales bacterium]
MNRVIIKDIYSKNLKRNKRVRIILPLNYSLDNKSYPVIYMHDGQNLIDPSPFSNHSWEVMETMDQYYEQLGGVIIVGVDSDSVYRIMEYSNDLNRSAIKRLKSMNAENIKPEADEYGKFLVEELKPLIDKEFQTKKEKEFTFMAGSSCGGNISIYLGLKYQDVFSCIGAFSPAYYIVKKGLYEFLDSIEINQTFRIYHDMGTKENGFFSKIYFNEQKVFHDYISKKMPKENLLQVIDEGATHSELHWAKRFKKFFEFCLNKKVANKN